MSFSLSSETDKTYVVVTVTGGTQAEPNKVSDLVTQIAGDATYSSHATVHEGGGVLNDIKFVLSTGSHFRFDDDYKLTIKSTFLWDAKKETTANANDGAGVQFGKRCNLVFKTTNTANDKAVYAIKSGGYLIAEADKNGQFPTILNRATSRNDFPSLWGTIEPAFVKIQGLNYVKTTVGGTPYLKWYFGNDRNINGDSVVDNLRAVNRNLTIQMFNTTYRNLKVGGLHFNGDASGGTTNTVRLIDSQFGLDLTEQKSLEGNLSRGMFLLDSPKFENWNGNFALNPGVNGSFLAIRYKQSFAATDGTNAISGLKIRLSRASQTATAAGTDYDLSVLGTGAQSEFIDLVTDSNGNAESYLIDSIVAQGIAPLASGVDGDPKTYQYTAVARSYLHNEPTLFSSRIYGRGGLDGNSAETVVLTLDSEVSADYATALAYTVLATGQEMYDHVKAAGVADVGKYAAMPVARRADGYDWGGFDVVVNKNATAVFEISGNVVTLKADVLKADLKTTGTITAINGAVIEGSIRDSTANSELLFLGIDSWQVYGTVANRDANVQPLASGTVDRWRFAFISGREYFLRVYSGGVGFFLTASPQAEGVTEVSLTDQALLFSLSGRTKSIEDEVGEIYHVVESTHRSVSHKDEHKNFEVYLRSATHATSLSSSQITTKTNSKNDELVAIGASITSTGVLTASTSTSGGATVHTAELYMFLNSDYDLHGFILPAFRQTSDLTTNDAKVTYYGKARGHAEKEMGSEYLGSVTSGSYDFDNLNYSQLSVNQMEQYFGSKAPKVEYIRIVFSGVYTGGVPTFLSFDSMKFFRTALIDVVKNTQAVNVVEMNSKTFENSQFMKGVQKYELTFSDSSTKKVHFFEVSPYDDTYFTSRNLWGEVNGTRFSTVVTAATTESSEIVLTLADFPTGLMNGNVVYIGHKQLTSSGGGASASENATAVWEHLLGDTSAGDRLTQNNSNIVSVTGTVVSSITDFRSALTVSDVWDYLVSGTSAGDRLIAAGTGGGGGGLTTAQTEAAVVSGLTSFGTATATNVTNAQRAVQQTMVQLPS